MRITASTFFPFDTPLRDSVWPRYSTEDWAKTHLSRLHRSPLSCRRCSNARRFRRCCHASAPPTSRLSIYTATPWRSHVSLSIIFWKYPGAEVIPKGNRVCNSIPLWVLSANRLWLSGANMTWLYASARSIFETRNPLPVSASGPLGGESGGDVSLIES